MSDSDKKRIKSALLLLLIAVAAVAVGGVAFAAVAAAVLAAAALEWGDIAMKKPGRIITAAMTIGWAAVLLLSQQFVTDYPTILCLIAFLGLWLASVILDKVGQIWWLVAGSVYLAFAFAAFVWIRHFGGWQPTLWLLVTAAATDVASYVGGKRFGGRLLMPKISPKKTYSGAVSGAVAALLVGSLGALLLFGAPQHKLLFIGLSLPVGLAAILGDGFESFFKRQFLVKDSSNLIPGHGGVLDVVDSHLMASIFLAVVMSSYA